MSRLSPACIDSSESPANSPSARKQMPEISRRRPAPPPRSCDSACALLAMRFSSRRRRRVVFSTTSHYVSRLRSQIVCTGHPVSVEGGERREALPTGASGGSGGQSYRRRRRAEEGFADRSERGFGGPKRAKR